MEELCEEFCAVNTTNQAPVNICLQDTKPIEVPDLVYSNYNATPTKMKINNSGYTATVSGKYAEGTWPVISGGPLTAPYKFSQLHFHWGADNGEGSEHTMDCRQLPFEMHAVHIKCTYPNQEAALQQKDGVIILAYLFVPGKTNAALQAILNDLSQINKAHSAFKVTPRPVGPLVPQLTRDYFTYWGAVISPSCAHLIQWLVFRDPLELSLDQLEPFRQLLNVNNEPLKRNYRDIQSLGKRQIFHCSPGSRTGTAIALSASRIALLRAVDPCDACPATDVEGACTSLDDAESKSKFSHPHSRQPSTKSSTAVSSRAPSPDQLQKSVSQTQEVAHVCVPADILQQTTPGCLEVSLKSSDICAPSMQSVPLASTQTAVSSDKQPIVANSAETIKSEEVDKNEVGAGPEDTAKSGDAEGAAQPGEASQPDEASNSVDDNVIVSLAGMKDASSQGSQKEPSRAAGTTTSTSQISGHCCRPYRISEAGIEGSRPSSRGYMFRGINFDNIPGIVQRSGSEFPDNPFTTEPLRSPINIEIRDAKRMPLPPLQFEHHFDPDTGLALVNTGETVEIDYLQPIGRPYLSGGPLQGKYRLDSIHFHWIPSDDVDGGTHTINNTRTEIELHMVHIKEIYQSKTEAMGHPNALAVVCLLLQVELPDSDLAWLASAAKPHDYFLYPGRFFGRTDGQSILWFVYAQPIDICCQNVAQFQKLKTAAGYKPHETHPLENRPLIAAVAIDSMSVGSEDFLANASTSRTATDRIATVPRNQWPNVPFKSKHTCLCAPLDINTDSVISLGLPQLEFVGHFVPGVSIELKNTGEAVNVKWREVSPMPHLSGGPLLEDYEFDSAHFHWAQNPDDVGAMHRINGRRFDLECHMVHFRKSCGTRQEAMFSSDGLCVVSFLLQVGGEDNPSFAQIAEALPEIRQVDQTTEVRGSLCFVQSRARPHGYFLYPGTLFGADKGINVIWIVYPRPVLVCCQYVAQFYKLECMDFDRMHTMHETLERPIYRACDPESYEV